MSEDCSTRRAPHLFWEDCEEHSPRERPAGVDIVVDGESVLAPFLVRRLIAAFMQARVETLFTSHDREEIVRGRRG